jgi:tetratricopeptide (TPR) repeat protein
LKVAYESLPKQQQNLLGQIACFRSPVNMDTLTAICKPVKTKSWWGFLKKTLNLYVGKLENDLRDLVERGLLHVSHHSQSANHQFTNPQSTTFDLHPIVRRYAYDRLTAPERTNSHGILIIYFEAVPKPEKVNTLEDLAPIIELYHHMVRAGNLDEACDLFYDRLHNALYYQFGAYQLIVELSHALFLDGEDKLPRLKKDDDQAWALNVLANVYSLSGQPRRAIPLFEMRTALREKLGDKKNLAIGLGNVADDQLKIGALSAAERNNRYRIELSREIGEEHSEAIGHEDVGRISLYCGKWDVAEQELTMALNTYEKQKDLQGQSVLWSYRALRFLLMAHANPQSSIVNCQSAIECAQRALELADEDTKQRYTHPRDYVRAHWLLGSTYRANNELSLAEENLSKALNLCRQINLVDTEADILLDLARLSFAYALRSAPGSAQDKLFEEAKSRAEEALVITERSGYVLQGADVNLFLAQYALEQEKDKAKAKEYAETALKLATCDGPPYYYKVAYEEAEKFLEKLK